LTVVPAFVAEHGVIDNARADGCAFMHLARFVNGEANPRAGAGFDVHQLNGRRADIETDDIFAL